MYKAQLEREIKALSVVRDDGWVDLDNLTCHIPPGLIDRCAVFAKNWYNAQSTELVKSLATPPSRGPILAMALMYQFTALECIEYPRRVFSGDGQSNNDYMPLTVHSPSHRGQPMDFLLAKKKPAGFGPFLGIDDVLRDGDTLWTLIHNIQRLWATRCLGVVVLVEIASAGGRARLEASFPGLPVLALARLG